MDKFRIAGRWGSSPGEFADVCLDPLTEALTVIDFPHYKIHQGKSFTAGRVVVHGAGASPNILIVTPASGDAAHFTYNAISNDVLQLTLYKDADYSGGAALTAVNRNQFSSTASGLTLTTDAADDGSGKGTSLWSFKTGAHKDIAGTAGYNKEFILKSNTKYLLEVVGLSGDIITMLLDWYEQELKHL